MYDRLDLILEYFKILYHFIPLFLVWLNNNVSATHAVSLNHLSRFREGAQIVSSPDFEIIKEGETHSLYIPEVFYEDSGKFSVKVSFLFCVVHLKLKFRNVWESDEKDMK